jgi:hypothetical protein
MSRAKERSKAVASYEAWVEEREKSRRVDT